MIPKRLLTRSKRKRVHDRGVWTCPLQGKHFGGWGHIRPSSNMFCKREFVAKVNLGLAEYPVPF